MHAANEQRWRELWQRLTAQGDPQPAWRILYAAYTETCRAYHNLHHINHCLQELAEVANLANNPDAMEAAIWFHDAVYDTHAKDNEERSAALAETILRSAGLAEPFCQKVVSLVLATKHQVPPSDNDAALLVDIDLSILGASREQYVEFERQIRVEYAWVDSASFATGRTAVLKSFLVRKSVFSHELFVVRYELRARENLTWAIAQLGS